MSLIIDDIEPSKGVEKPVSLDQLSSLLREADGEGIGIVPFGGGTRLDVGSIPTKYDIALDLSAFDQIVSHNPADLTCTVGAGITVGVLQETLAAHGQFLAVDTPLPDKATIGGTIASSALGYLRWQLGHPRDTVIGMEVILANGTVTKSGGQVVKNVSGYDMARLHVGGLGTLGIISKVSFKLTPRPFKELSVKLLFRDSYMAHSFAHSLFGSSMMPLAFASVHGDAVELFAGQSSKTDVFCAIKIGGRLRACDRQVAIVEKLARDFEAQGIQTVDEAESDLLWQSIRDYSGSSNKFDSIIGRIYASPSNMHEIEETLVKRLSVSSSIYSLICQQGFGAALLFVEDSENKSEVSLLKDLREIVNRFQSTLVFEKLPPLLKASIDVWDSGRLSSIEQMKSLKKTYDPNSTLNAGRFVAGI
ncbi:uncharacterized protein METZ01_LOCUS62652 [marine metagenome]|uniref:FAD-binding PCMH-type domain-containing protein n=1 Tax=marine metagenome TaxID=408172 RepID=A0A381T2K7_9ZZZZ